MPYDAEKRQFAMPTPANMQEAGLMIVALGGAIMTLLDQIAETHENKPGAWLDDIEEIILRDAKGNISEGVDITSEATGMKLGIDILDALLQRVRRRLIVTEE